MKALIVRKLLDSADSSFPDFPSIEHNVPIPATTKRNDILVHIHAAGCNFFDILMMQGKYQHRPSLPFIPGAEFSGTVIKKHCESNERWKIGDRVVGICQSGAFGGYIAVPSASLLEVPERMSFEQAAGFVMTYATALYALKYRGELRQGETLLIHAAAGGVGSAAVQIGKALGAKVVATAGSDEKLGIAINCGADVAINYREDWVEKVKGIGEIDVVFDPVGGDVFLESTKCVGWNARLLVIGFASGTIPKLPVNRLLLKSASAVGVFFGASRFKDPETFRKVIHDIFQLFIEKKVDPVIYKVYSLEDIKSGLLALNNRKSYGKVIIKMRSSSRL